MIKTTLTPGPIGFESAPYTVVVKGASAEINFAFDEYSYLRDYDSPWYKYLEQITFLFKEAKKDIVSYQMWDKDKPLDPYDPDNINHSPYEMDKHFGYDEYSDSIIFLLTPKETSALGLTGTGDLIEFEIAIEANTDQLYPQKKDTIIIERQLPIMVVDSLYSQAGRPGEGPDVNRFFLQARNPIQTRSSYSKYRGN